MDSDRNTILRHVRNSLCHDERWSRKLAGDSSEEFGLHLAILREPYLTFIMEGRKKVESRFAKRPCAPYERVAEGDVVVLKPVGGDIVGVCEVEKVWFYRVDSTSLEFIKQRFGSLICPADASFWQERESKTVATLMLIKNVSALSGIRIQKRDRRGWVTYSTHRELELFT
jgi:hypothetical protein